LGRGINLAIQIAFLETILKLGLTPKSQILTRSTKGTFLEGFFPYDSSLVTQKMQVQVFKNYLTNDKIKAVKNKRPRLD
jgi:hypothetical protein